MVEKIIEQYRLTPDETKVFRQYLAEKANMENYICEWDLSFLNLWDDIYRYAMFFGVDEAINHYLCPKLPIEFTKPVPIKLEFYESFCGRLPVLYIEDAELFEKVVTNVVYKGNPPESLSETGASFVFGKRTRFMILSNKPYSNVPAEEIGLPREDWLQKSMVIRREHECTHYYTKLAFHRSEFHMHDELVADFFGFYEAFGSFSADYFLRCIGVLPGSGHRLHFYTSHFSDNLQQAIAKSVELAAMSLEMFSKTDCFLNMSREKRINQLYTTSLAEMIDM